MTALCSSAQYERRGSHNKFKTLIILSLTQTLWCLLTGKDTFRSDVGAVTQGK